MTKQKYYKDIIKEKNPCAAGGIDFTETTDDELLDKYVKYAEFVVENGVPTNGQVVRNFTGEQLTSKNIYITEGLEKVNPRGRHIIGGDHYHCVEFRHFSVGDLYVKDNAHLKISASDQAVVYVFAYDSCKIEVSTEDHAVVYVYRFNEAASVKGNASVRDRIG